MYFFWEICFITDNVLRLKYEFVFDKNCIFTDNNKITWHVRGLLVAFSSKFCSKTKIYRCVDIKVAKLITIRLMGTINTQINTEKRRHYND